MFNILTRDEETRGQIGFSVSQSYIYSLRLVVSFPTSLSTLCCWSATSSSSFLLNIHSSPTVETFVLARSRVDADDTMVNDDVHEIHFAILSY